MARPKSQFCKHGHDTNICGRDSRNACNGCKREWAKEHPNYLKEYYIKNKDILVEKHKEYHEANRDEMLAKMKEWSDTHRDQKKEIDKEYYEKNKIRLLALMKKWRESHRDIIRALKIKSQTNRHLRVVSWTDWDKIKEVYKNQPVNTEVDHIVPLQGNLVSGLHVSWNLQYLNPEVNRSKHNYIDLNEVSAWYGKILEEAGLK